MILPAQGCSFPAPAASANMAAFTHLVSSSRWRSATAPRPGSPPQRSSHLLCHSAPASNKPHPAEKRTPVWLAIWRIWAGFANSQHRDAAFATPNNICAHSFLLPHWAAAQTDANLSAHLHRLPTPPPYLRRMRLLPSRVLRSCKSPSTLGAATGTSGKG